MSNYLISTKTIMKEKYHLFTQVEKVVADYFLSEDIDDFSSKAVSQKLYVSEASLSRFAKKLGFSGYREFVFCYNSNLKESRRLDQLTEFAIYKYQEVLERTYKVVDNNQMIRITNMLNSSKRVFVYGIGSSAIAAKEFCLRFIRLGLDIEVLDSGDKISLNTTRVHSDCLVIGISVSGRNKEVLKGLKVAYEKGATTILLTSALIAENEKITHEIVLLAHLKNITVSHIISPQIPVLIMIDVIYTHYLNHNQSDKLESLKQILNQIEYKFEK